MNSLQFITMQDLEEAFNEALRDVALELRSLELIDLATLLHTEKFATLADIVHSTFEMYFMPDTMTFAYGGSVELGWFGRPAITLDLMFRHVGVEACLSLSIEAIGSSVRVRHLAVDGKRCALVSAKLARCCDAISLARVDRIFDRPISSANSLAGRLN